MAVPPFDCFFVSILKALSDGQLKKNSDICELVKSIYPLDEDSYLERVSSGKNRYVDRINWALTHLRKGNLVESPKRGYQRITNVGLMELNEGPKDFRIGYLLDRYPSIREFYRSTKKTEEEHVIPEADIMTPSEMLDFSISNLNRSLADELLNEIYKERDWSYFEKLVLRVMGALGYGGDSNDLKWTGKSGDEGIDGEIYEDKLGFDKIYIQAKHFKPGNPVNDSIVRNFIGSMSVKGVSKGVIITTSSFTENARKLAQNNPNFKLKLIDGEDLVKLMIDNNIGVSIARTYYVKKLDSDFFDDI